MIKTGKFYTKLSMSIFRKKNSCRPVQVFLNETLYVKLPKNLVFFSLELLLLLDTEDTWESSFFQHQNKTKVTNFTKHGTKICLLHYFIIIITKLKYKASWHAGGRSSSLGICKSSSRLRSWDENIFEPERIFFDVLILLWISGV